MYVADMGTYGDANAMHYTFSIRPANDHLLIRHHFVRLAQVTSDNLYIYSPK